MVEYYTHPIMGGCIIWLAAHEHLPTLPVLKNKLKTDIFTMRAIVPCIIILFNGIFHPLVIRSIRIILVIRYNTTCLCISEV